MISTHTKDSCENNGPNLPVFQIFYKKIDNFLQQFSAGNQNTKMMLKFFYFIIWFIEKIGLIFLRMIAQFGYIKRKYN
jgi:hypothetical protein